VAQAQPGAVFEATYDAGITGLVGVLEVAINDNQNAIVYGPTSALIIELTVGGNPTGSYRAMLTAPADEGQFVIIWSNDGSFDEGTGGEEDLLVQLTTLPSLPAPGADLSDSILCSAWTTSEDALACCPTDNIASDVVLLDAAIVASSETLYLASGKQFPGVCETTVRPCRADDCTCGVQVLSRGHLVGWDGNCWGGYSCGCRAVSTVRLAGRVREITEVLIDGAVVDPSEYFVYAKRDLVRKDGAFWPRCQSMDVDDDAEGAFTVTYTYGKPPPVSGQLAAARLACEIVKSCRNDDTCALPTGVIRITRQGITMERTFFLRDRDGRWVTGMGEVDYFLNTVNPNGLQRVSTFWSPFTGGQFAETHPS
jgi:hypothetical protein